MMTSSICDAATPESASAALIAAEPSCGAETVANPPWKAPTGVRRAAKITTGSDFIGHFRVLPGCHYRRDARIAAIRRLAAIRRHPAILLKAPAARLRPAQ